MECPAHGTRCLIVLIVFASPPKANTKDVPHVIALDFRSVEGKGRGGGVLRGSRQLRFAALIMTLELFPLLFPHVTYIR